MKKFYRALTFITFSILSIVNVSFAQSNSLSIIGGISNSSVPLYTQVENANLISSQSVNNLAFGVSYNLNLKKNFLLKFESNFKIIGVNSLNRLPDQVGNFVNNISLNYISVATLPTFELEFGQYSFSFSIGPSVSYLLKGQSINFFYRDNILVNRETENINLESFDYGINVGAEVNRVIANNIKLVLAVRRYQGLHNINVTSGEDKAFVSNSVLSMGLAIPLLK